MVRAVRWDNKPKTCQRLGMWLGWWNLLSSKHAALGLIFSTVNLARWYKAIIATADARISEVLGHPPKSMEFALSLGHMRHHLNKTTQSAKGK